MISLQVNTEIVAIQRVSTSAGEQQLRQLIETHAELTGSRRAKAILADWQAQLPQFWQLVPPSESGTPEASAAAEELSQNQQLVPAAA